MTKKIHVLADETLGGIEREYVEVDRKEEVGELINVFGHQIKPANGIFKVKSVEIRFGSKVYIYGDEGYGTPYYRGNGGITYNTLEPTDIVHIEGKRYNLVNRKAEVGERVIYCSEEGKSDGIVTDVLDSRPHSTIIDVRYENGLGEKVYGICHGSYLVLDPIESENKPTSNAPQSTDDIIANLVRRVAQLERQIEDYVAKEKTEMKRF